MTYNSFVQIHRSSLSVKARKEPDPVERDLAFVLVNREARDCAVVEPRPYLNDKHPFRYPGLEDRSVGRRA